jgi:hypothetical protein
LCVESEAALDKILGVGDDGAPPALMFFEAWKLKQPQFPSRPTLRPRHCATHAWQASSMSAGLCLRATASTVSMSAGLPPMCTGMTPSFVR